MSIQNDFPIAQADPVVMEGICKSFGPVRALHEVCLKLGQGEIRALVGENGAGKTTLMNILYGIYRPDSGQIRIQGHAVGQNWSPRQAIASGIGMIHQHFSLILDHTVLENVVMPKLGWADVRPHWGKHRAEMEKLSAEYHFSVSPDARVGSLSVGEQQQVEILKLLYQGARVLILDEPTAVLTPQQTDALLHLLTLLRSQNLSVVFITHKLTEALSVSDNITVLRSGELVGTVPWSEANPREIARMMVGRPTLAMADTRRPDVGERPVLKVDSLVVAGEFKQIAVDHVSFDIKAGEIVGVAGVSGNGQAELVHALVGISPARGGRVLIDGQDATGWTIARRRRAGLSLVHEDRHQYGIVPDLTVAENVIIDRAGELPFSRLGVFNRGLIRRTTEEIIREYDIRTSGPDALVKRLSGGNQQKVVLARALSGAVRCLIVSEPTRGLDFAATEYVRNRLLACAGDGVGVLLISSDLEELLALSHRLLVMYRGRVVGELPREHFDLEEIGLLMTGHEQPGPTTAKAGGSGGTSAS